MNGLLAFVSLALATSAYARTFTVKNNCAFTIWPGLFTDLNAGTAVPDHATGWEQASGATETITVPDNWTAGRIWGRTDCDFSTNPGPTSCVTGGCNGGLECDPSTGTGVPPATVAEWTLSAAGDADWYDVSLVDGFNLPVTITPTAGCSEASCPVDLNPDCPAEIAGPTGANGANAGCKSACLANLDGNQQDSANCCSGSHNTAETCPPSGVQDYDYFKSSCPNAYAYAYDESSGTALWTCPSGSAADYTVTFCP
ncbi:Osmotin, thaumatin-like protein [Cylindrobasidium torrendii FP15055 ss-10]|uniref:Osmotin, thaumatin-like protein n=1 Tax=Cylindrobasidium torrendii FP15055 ss-10 TaxID=1314674 RepID=A0A0D7BPF4_9AGAR|nr:Osmotin, thaumatin-like protein [Cylindrobasidium torrendii FP15055 ss-10]